MVIFTYILEMEIFMITEPIKDSKELRTFVNYYNYVKPSCSDYLFTKSTDHSRPLNRTQAYRIIKAAAAACHLTGNISCHSLRKTFGFFAWKQGTQPALLMAIYNHSSYNITKRYLGITQLEKDAIYMSIHFPC